MSHPLREAASLLESEPAGRVDVQPGADLADWTRGPWPATASLGPPQRKLKPLD